MTKINMLGGGSYILRTVDSLTSSSPACWFGEEYRRYKDRVPAFFPKLGADRTIPQP